MRSTGSARLTCQAAQKLQVTAIGDSVMASSSDILHQLLPHAVIDATVSRQANVAPQLLQSYAQKGELQDNVLIGLGTNGPFTDDEVKQIMQIVGRSASSFGSTSSCQPGPGKTRSTSSCRP